MPFFFTEMNLKKFTLVTVAGLWLIALAAFPAMAQTGQSRHPQLEMSAVPALDQDQVRQLQQVLQEKGFEPGPIDGIFGLRTKEALSTFQDRYGVKVSGEFDNQTLYALGKPEYAGP